MANSSILQDCGRWWSLCPDYFYFLRDKPQFYFRRQSAPINDYIFFQKYFPAIRFTMKLFWTLVYRWKCCVQSLKGAIQGLSVHSLSRVRLFATPWIAARQASLSITNSWSLLKPMSIESVMLSNHFILCRPLLLLPPVPPSIRVFSSESTLGMR